MPAVAHPTQPRMAMPIWCLALGATSWLLHTVGTDDLATPPAPWHWGSWLTATDPAAAIVAVIRVGAVIGCWYLVVATVAGAVVRRAGTRRGVTAADRLTPRFLRALLNSAAGLTLSAAGLTAATTPLLTTSVSSSPAVAAAPSQSEPRAGPTLRRIPSPSDDSEPLWSQDPGGDHNQPTGAAELEPFVFRLGPLAPARPDESTTWLVETGDHFWHIAEETLADAWERPPSNREIDGYWRDLIDANRGILLVPDDPDILLPGQVVEVVAPPPAPEPTSRSVAQPPGV